MAVLAVLAHTRLAFEQGIKAFLDARQTFVIRADNPHQVGGGVAHRVITAVIVLAGDTTQMQLGNVIGDALLDFTPKVDKAAVRIAGNGLLQLRQRHVQRLRQILPFRAIEIAVQLKNAERIGNNVFGSHAQRQRMAAAVSNGAAIGWDHRGAQRALVGLTLKHRAVEQLQIAYAGQQKCHTTQDANTNKGKALRVKVGLCSRLSRFFWRHVYFAKSWA